MERGLCTSMHQLGVTERLGSVASPATPHLADIDSSKKVSKHFPRKSVMGRRGVAVGF